MRRADTAWLSDWTLKLTLRAAEGTFSPTARAEGSRPSWGAQPSQRLPGQQHWRLALLQETPELTVPAVPALHAINTSPWTAVPQQRFLSCREHSLVCWHCWQPAWAAQGPKPQVSKWPFCSAANRQLQILSGIWSRRAGRLQHPPSSCG